MKSVDDEIHRHAMDSSYDMVKVKRFLNIVPQNETFRMEIDRNLVTIYYKADEGEYDINEKDELVDLLSFLRGIIKYDLIFLMTPDSQRDVLSHLDQTNSMTLYAFYYNMHYTYGFSDFETDLSI